MTHDVGQTRHELATPIRGAFDVKAEQVAGSSGWFGATQSVDVSILPLQQVAVETHKEVATAEAVSVGGSAALVQQDVLRENKLPAGRYIMTVTLWGAMNWDRQTLFFEVTGE